MGDSASPVFSPRLIALPKALALEHQRPAGLTTCCSPFPFPCSRLIIRDSVIPEKTSSFVSLSTAGVVRVSLPAGRGDARGVSDTPGIG